MIDCKESKWRIYNSSELKLLSYFDITEVSGHLILFKTHTFYMFSGIVVLVPWEKLKDRFMPEHNVLNFLPFIL